MIRRTGHLSAMFVAAVLVSGTALVVAGCAPTETRSSTGEYIDDTVITAKVKTAIFNEPDLSAAEINVETFRGEVQLSGFVTSRAHADRAVEVARGVAGVESVKNDMRVK